MVDNPPSTATVSPTIACHSKLEYMKPEGPPQKKKKKKKKDRCANAKGNPGHVDAILPWKNARSRPRRAGRSARGGGKELFILILKNSTYTTYNLTGTRAKSEQEEQRTEKPLKEMPRKERRMLEVKI